MNFSMKLIIVLNYCIRDVDICEAERIDSRKIKTKTKAGV